MQISLLAFMCACEIPAEESTVSQRMPPLELAESAGIENSPDRAESIPVLEPSIVTDISELPGDYYRPFAVPGQLSFVSLGINYGGGEGRYSATRSCGVPNCLPEAGTYHATPINAAIGFASLLLAPDSVSATLVDTYLLDFIWRDVHGEIVGVQMRRLLPGDVRGLPFVMFRYPDEDALLQERQGAEIVSGDPNGVVTLAASGDVPVPDLADVYVRPLPRVGEMGALTLNEPNWEGQTGVGAYSLARPHCLPWCLPEAGQYTVEIENPITGTGWLTLHPATDPEAEVIYLIDGIWRNPAGSLVALQLQRSYQFSFGAPFFLYRQWWDDEDADASSLPNTPEEPTLAAASGSLCLYYSSLEDYYRTRSLQCAYSACFPLSSLYGWWANHYHELAESACSPE